MKNGKDACIAAVTDKTLNIGCALFMNGSAVFFNICEGCICAWWLEECLYCFLIQKINVSISKVNMFRKILVKIPIEQMSKIWEASNGFMSGNNVQARSAIIWSYIKSEWRSNCTTNMWRKSEWDEKKKKTKNSLYVELIKNRVVRNLKNKRQWITV